MAVSFLSIFSCRSTLICFLWKRECRQNCYTLWERSPATWHEVLLAFLSLSFYCHCCCSLWDTSRKKENQGVGCGVGGIQQKMWKRREKPWVVTELVGWMLRRGSEQMEARKYKKRARKNCQRTSSQTTSGYTNSVRVACSAKTDQERAAWSITPALRGSLCRATHTGGIQGRRFSIPACNTFVANLFEWRPTVNPQKAVQPATVCTLILSSLLYLFSFFNILIFHFLY